MIKYLPNGKNLVKIGPVESEFFLLKCLFKKQKKRKQNI